MLHRLGRRGSAPANASVAAIGPARVTRPSRLATAWCSTVTSLKPTSTRGPAARIASQSSRSTIRAAPEPPRAQTTARVAGSHQACCRSAARCSSVPARCRRRSSACRPTTTSRPQDRRVATPRSSRSGTRVPLVATTATRSPGASRRGRSSGSQRLSAARSRGGRWRRDVHLDLATEPGARLQGQVVTAPEAARVVPARAPPGGQQAHRLVGQGDHLGAVGGLQADVPRVVPDPRQPAADPPAGQPAPSTGTGSRPASRWCAARRPPSRESPAGPAGAARPAGRSGAPRRGPRRPGRAAGRRAGGCRTRRRAATGRAPRATSAAAGRRGRRPCRRG